MFRLTVRSLLAHRARLVATALAVMLGIGFVAGTYVLTDTLRASLESVVSQSSHSVDAVVQGTSALSGSATGTGAGAGSGDPLSAGTPVPDSTTAKVAAVPGVAAADGQVVGPASLIGADGKPVGSQYGLSVGLSVGTVPALRSLELRSGRFAASSDQVDLDVATAASERLHLGQQVRVAGNGPVRTMTLVGLVTYGGSTDLGGTVILGFDLPTAEAIAGVPGHVQAVLVAAGPGVGADTVVARIRSALGPGYTVLNGAQYLQQRTDTLSQGLGFLSTALLIFAGVGLFVGSFIIFNTFSIVVAQRSRELALLRCLGAFRHQLLVMVVGESALVGLVASAFGLVVGVGLAAAAKAGLAATGASFPPASLQVAPRTIVVALVLGTTVTVVAALLPAVRAGRAAPLGALRDDGAASERSSTWHRLALGTVLAVVGVAAIGFGLFGPGGNRAPLSGVGVVCVFLAVSALGPSVVRPMASVLGRPAGAVSGTMGRLARENAMRNPRRTSATSAALMIGLALVTLVAVFSQTIKASLVTALDDHLTSDAVVSPYNLGSGGFSPSVAAALSRVPQLTDVAGLASGQAQVVGGGAARIPVTGVDVPAFLRNVQVETIAGSLLALDGPRGAQSVAVSDTFASSHHLAVGDDLGLVFPTAGTRALQVVAVYHDPTTAAGNILLSDAGFASAYPVARSDENVLVRWAPGVSEAEGVRALSAALVAFPQVQGQTKAAYIATQLHTVDQVLVFVVALLALAVVIALFGIVNTLALSVMERTREIGLLRALGTSRRQVREMIRWESVIIAVIGSVLGTVVGLAFAWVLTRALRSQGLTTFAVPWVTLALVVVAAAVAGVVAAVVPARRAQRIDVLAAIAVE